MVKILQNKKFIADFCKKNHINYLAVFGSCARGDERADSDIDLLVDFSKTKSLFDFAQIKFNLEDKIGREVDLVMKKNVKPFLRPFIKKDLATLYEKR